MQGLEIDATRAGQAREAYRDGSGRRLSQAAAARKLRVHPVTLNKIENGKANVSLELLERMASLYGCTREWLCGQTEAVDPLADARDRVAHALTEIGSGLEELSDIVELLNGQARGTVAKAALV